MKKELKDLNVNDEVNCICASDKTLTKNERIVKITTETEKYKQFKVIWLENNRKFDSRTGFAMNPSFSYYIKCINIS